MAISQKMAQAVSGASMIRKMFEEGARRVKLYGAENVFDFSIGNPVFEPPKEVKNSLVEILNSGVRGGHRYMPNAGYPDTRQHIAGQLKSESGLSFEMDDILMTVGAGGALNVVLKTLLDPEDEVIILSPFFVEYKFYIENYLGVVKVVSTTDDFRIDCDAIEKAITPKTKAVLINSPNNPTGVIYSEEELTQLGQLLSRKSEEAGHPITLISDEPYKNISYEKPVPSIFTCYRNSVVGTSYSKDLALPGERIGYLAISPDHDDHDLLRDGAVIALRILGFVNAPALMQRMLPMIGDAKVDMTPYRENRELLYNHLTKIGFECQKPDGGFYLFPKSPIEDDMAFITAAQEYNLLLVPGRAFGAPGYFRIAYCFDTDMVKRSLPVFSKLAEHYQLTGK